MAAPKRGSRRITVDGETYFWRVRQKPSYSQALQDSPLTFSVELDGANGAIMIAVTDGFRPDSWKIRHTGPNAPAAPIVVAAAIREALAAGWKPSEPGSPHCIGEHLSAEFRDSGV